MINKIADYMTISLCGMNNKDLFKCFIVGIPVVTLSIYLMYLLTFPVCILILGLGCVSVFVGFIICSNITEWKLKRK
jgi:hypothetical protein